jgi:hypothetical protein
VCVRECVCVCVCFKKGVTKGRVCGGGGGWPYSTPDPLRDTNSQRPSIHPSINHATHRLVVPRRRLLRARRQPPRQGVEAGVGADAGAVDLQDARLEDAGAGFCVGVVWGRGRRVWW